MASVVDERDAGLIDKLASNGVHETHAISGLDALPTEVHLGTRGPEIRETLDHDDLMTAAGSQ